ncbi:30S ribosomal protein S15 [Candidatus Woesearchaeota archaeon]|nr:30S ribosomal protein S15 [Candidatus Woesearchaeota archaeon]
MARMHSGKRGRHGSKKPSKLVKPSWLRYNTKEVEQLILKLSKAGKPSSQIGIVLRDVYGIPSVRVVTNKKINAILEENEIKPKIPEDLVAVIRKGIQVMKHLEANKKDMTAKRGLQLTESKIRRLAKYYKNVGKLPKDWQYNRESIKLLIS